MRENMDDVRGPRRAGCPDLILISLLSTGEARGANSLLRVYWICMKDVAASLFTSTLSCAVSLSVNFFPAYPAERCALNG